MSLDLPSIPFKDWLPLLVMAAAVWAAFDATRRSRAIVEWKANWDASEQRVRVLEAQVEAMRREVFDQSVLLADMKRNNTNVGLKNLDLQRQVDALSRREKQLVAALKAAGIPVPEAQDPDPW